VLSGTVQMTFVSMGQHMDFVRRGDLRILGVAAGKRVSYLPDVPTFAEQGLPGFEASTWFALFAPRGTPADIVEALNRHVRDLAGDPDARRRLDASFVEPMPLGLADFTALVRSDAERWKSIVRAAGAHMD